MNAVKAFGRSITPKKHRRKHEYDDHEQHHSHRRRDEEGHRHRKLEHKRRDSHRRQLKESLDYTDDNYLGASRHTEDDYPSSQFSSDRLSSDRSMERRNSTASERHREELDKRRKEVRKKHHGDSDDRKTEKKKKKKKKKPLEDDTSDVESQGRLNRSLTRIRNFTLNLSNSGSKSKGSGEIEKKLRRQSSSMHGSPSTDANFLQPPARQGSNSRLNRSLTRISDLAHNLNGTASTKKPSSAQRLLEREEGLQNRPKLTRESSSRSNLDHRSQDRRSRRDSPNHHRSEKRLHERHMHHESKTTVRREARRHHDDYLSERSERDPRRGKPDGRRDHHSDEHKTRSIQLSPVPKNRRVIHQYGDDHSVVSRHSAHSSKSRVSTYSANSRLNRSTRERERRYDDDHSVKSRQSLRQKRLSMATSSTVMSDVKLSTLMYHREWDTVHLFLFDEGNDVDGYHQSSKRGMSLIELSCFEGEQGVNLLHVVCRHQPPLHVVYDVCQEWPWMALQPDQFHGRFALHMACLYGCKSSVVLYLLDLYVEAALRQDILGCVPLHYACRPIRWSPEEEEEEVSDEPQQLIRPGLAVIEALCEVEPSAVSVPDFTPHELTPLDWAEHYKLSPSIRQILADALNRLEHGDRDTSEEEEDPDEPEQIYRPKHSQHQGEYDRTRRDKKKQHSQQLRHVEPAKHKYDEHDRDDHSYASDGSSSHASRGNQSAFSHISIGGSRHGRRDPKLDSFLRRHSRSNSFREDEDEKIRHTGPCSEVARRGSIGSSRSARSHKSSGSGKKSVTSLFSRRSNGSGSSGKDLSTVRSFLSKGIASTGSRNRSLTTALYTNSPVPKVKLIRSQPEALNNDDRFASDSFALSRDDSLSSLETATQLWNEHYGTMTTSDEESSSNGDHRAHRRRPQAKSYSSYEQDVMSQKQHDNESEDDIEDEMLGSSHSGSHDYSDDEKLLYQNSSHDHPQNMPSSSIASSAGSSSQDPSEDDDEESLLQPCTDDCEDLEEEEELLFENSSVVQGHGEASEEHIGSSPENDRRDAKTNNFDEKEAAVSNSDSGKQRKHTRRHHKEDKEVYESHEKERRRLKDPSRDKDHKRIEPPSPESARSSVAVYRGKRREAESMRAEADIKHKKDHDEEDEAEDSPSSPESIRTSMAVAAALRSRSSKFSKDGLDLSDPQMMKKIAELCSIHPKGSSRSSASTDLRNLAKSSPVVKLDKQRSLPSLKKEASRRTLHKEKSRESLESRESAVSKQSSHQSSRSSRRHVSEDQIRDLLRSAKKDRDHDKLMQDHSSRKLDRDHRRKKREDAEPDLRSIAPRGSRDEEEERISHRRDSRSTNSYTRSSHSQSTRAHDNTTSGQGKEDESTASTVGSSSSMGGSPPQPVASALKPSRRGSMGSACSTSTSNSVRFKTDVMEKYGIEAGA